jgi:hypothetical protein
MSEKHTAGDTSRLPILFMAFAVMMLAMESSMERHPYVGGWTREPMSRTTSSVTDQGGYVTEDWNDKDGNPCGQILKWKDYRYLPNKPHGYEVYIWGQFRPPLVFGTLRDAEQYIRLNWCRP